MMLRLASLALSAACFAACGSSPSDPPDAAASGDAAVDASADAPAISGDCSGLSERFILSGAVTLDAHSAAAFTISGKVGGVVGAPMPDRLYTLAPRAQLATDFDVLGMHDIATVPVKFMDKQNNVDCGQPDACRGFFALAGTLEVLEHDPRYRARFMLTDLHHHDDTTNTIGAPFAGTVTGCVNANR